MQTSYLDATLCIYGGHKTHYCRGSQLATRPMQCHFRPRGAKESQQHRQSVDFTSISGWLIKERRRRAGEPFCVALMSSRGQDSDRFAVRSLLTSCLHFLLPSRPFAAVVEPDTVNDRDRKAYSPFCRNRKATKRLFAGRKTVLAENFGQNEFLSAEICCIWVL